MLSLCVTNQIVIKLTSEIALIITVRDIDKFKLIHKVVADDLRLIFFLWLFLLALEAIIVIVHERTFADLQVTLIGGLAFELTLRHALLKNILLR